LLLELTDGSRMTLHADELPAWIFHALPKVFGA
jgi:hypothetical protein